jgi:hypothetical protein
MRDLRGPLQAGAIRDLIQSLFVAEVLKPSKPLWILSAWIADIPVIMNHSRQFSGIDPDWPTGAVHLSKVFRTILTRGGRISLVLRDVVNNQRFVDELYPLKKEFESQLSWFLGEHEHEKCIVGEDFVLSGSMNFTRRGITTNGEHIVFRTALGDAATSRIALRQLWPKLADPDV